MPDHRVFLSIGSNLGGREEHLLGAVSLMEQDPAVTVTGLSPLYETEPVGVSTDRPFVNAVARIEYGGSPRSLLRLCRRLEKGAGREGPGPDRPLDIDILLFGLGVTREEDLVIPHPRLRERLFVLRPLADIDPDLVLPPDGAVVKELARSLTAGGWVRKVSDRARLTVCAPA